MCLICIDFARGALKLREARRALGEMREKVGAGHAREVERMLDEAQEEDPPATPVAGTP